MQSKRAQAGDISSKLAGGTFLDGVKNGLITAGLNHAMHSVADGLFSKPTPRPVNIEVTENVIGTAYIKPSVESIGNPVEFYEVPIYEMIVSGYDDAGNYTSESFGVVRFGVKNGNVQGAPAGEYSLTWLGEKAYGNTGGFKIDKFYDLHVGNSSSYKLENITKMANYGCISVCSVMGRTVSQPWTAHFKPLIQNLSGTTNFYKMKINLSIQPAVTPTAIKHLKTW